MAFLGTDNLAIDRSGTLYRTTGADVLAYVQSNLGTTERQATNIAARDALTGLSLGDTVFVTDATGDATVSSGGAIYRWTGSGWIKIYEAESLDVVSTASNLAYVAAGAGGSVTNSNGTGFTIPSVNGTNAGLMLPAHLAKVDFVTVTASTNLDAIRTASHAAASLAGSTSTNPLTISGQTLGFSIAQLSPAP